MWLINTATLLLENFQVCPVGQFAILSHRWEDGEVTFDDAQTGIEAQSKKGARKILLCCRQAQQEGMKYAWVDTCCIDKRSSAELSEAINSMYQWYAESRICYVYMCDVLSEDTSEEHSSTGRRPDAGGGGGGGGKGLFRESQWFTRGWTLQELIAPAKASFYDANWNYLGDKLSLASDLSSVTGIDQPVLHGKVPIQRYSVAQRMSWASTRVTTRIEDMAYSLLGIFDVNMPLLYGEGINAFRRLQEAILEVTDDESIFVWDGVDEGGSGLLAPSVSNFARSNKIIPYPQDKLPWPRHEYAMTNKGLKLEAGLSPFAVDTYFMSLECVSSDDTFGTQRIHIFLRPVSDLEPIFRRVSFHGIDWASTVQWREHRFRVPETFATLPLDDDFAAFELMLKTNSSRRSIYVPQRAPTTRDPPPPPPRRDICVTVSRSTKVQRATLLSRTYPETWVFPAPDSQPGFKQLSRHTLSWSARDHAAGFELDLRERWTRAVALKVGLDADFNPTALLAVARSVRSDTRAPLAPESWTLPHTWPAGNDAVVRRDLPHVTVWSFHMPKRRGKLGLCVKADSRESESSFSSASGSFTSTSSGGGKSSSAKVSACYVRLEIDDCRDPPSSRFAWKFSLHEERIDSLNPGIFEGRDWVTYRLS